MSERTDEQLILALGQGDRQALAALAERHHRTIVQFIYRYLGTGDLHTADDLAQDVFLSAWRSADTFEPRAKVLTWLLRIATNACLNYRRGARLRRVLPLDGGNEGPALASQESPADASQQRDEIGRVRRAVATLPAKQRAVIVLRHYHGLSYADLAVVLETSIPAVESLLFRARMSLRQVLRSPDRKENRKSGAGCVLNPDERSQ